MSAGCAAAYTCPAAIALFLFPTFLISFEFFILLLISLEQSSLMSPPLLSMEESDSEGVMLSLNCTDRDVKGRKTRSGEVGAADTDSVTANG